MQGALAQVESDGYTSSETRLGWSLGRTTMDDKANSPRPESETDHTVISGTRARQAVKIGTMRYVLGISLALAIVVLGVVYVFTRQ